MVETYPDNRRDFLEPDANGEIPVNPSLPNGGDDGNLYFWPDVRDLPPDDPHPNPYTPPSPPNRWVDNSFAVTKPCRDDGDNLIYQLFLNFVRYTEQYHFSVGNVFDTGEYLMGPIPRVNWSVETPLPDGWRQCDYAPTSFNGFPLRYAEGVFPSIRGTVWNKTPELVGEYFVCTGQPDTSTLFTDPAGRWYADLAFVQQQSGGPIDLTCTMTLTEVRMQWMYCDIISQPSSIIPVVTGLGLLTALLGMGSIIPAAVGTAAARRRRS